MKRVAASIEVSPKQAAESPDLPGLFPPETRVYITDLGAGSDDLLIQAARRVGDLGYRAVPHLAARRIAGREQLHARIAALSQEAGVRDMLIIGGGVVQPAGEFDSSLSVLETGYLDRYGIIDIAIAGHPEGNPDFPAEIALPVLRAKADFAERTGANLRIVTQFGFDGDRFVDWTRELAANGIDLPVHIGVAGPAKVTTLLKYAAACGVGNSVSILRKRSANMATLALGHSPEEVVSPIERHLSAHPDSNLHQIHVFAFGGLKTASEWLRTRGSWPDQPHAVQKQRKARRIPNMIKVACSSIWRAGR